MELHIINMKKDVLWYRDNKISLCVLSHAASPAECFPPLSVCFLDVPLCFLTLTHRLLFLLPLLNEILNDL